MKTVLCAAVALTFVGGAAMAQQAAAPAPAPAPSLGGPQIPGLCLLSKEAVFANAKVGLAAAQRLKELAAQAQAEIDVERNPLAAELQTLQGQRATLAPAEFQRRQEALAQRAQAVEQKAQIRSREIELTQQKALNRISTEAVPVIADVYKARGCGLVIDRNGVLGGNMAGDLTSDVVKGLDAKITIITFDRETLPAQAGGAAPVAVAPAPRPAASAAKTPAAGAAKKKPAG